MTENRENEIRQTLDELCAATQAKDADRVARLHAPGSALYDMAPPLGKPFDRDYLRDWLASKPGDRLPFELGDVTVHTAGDVAVAYGLAKMGGDGFELWHRMTWALRETDGRWLIVHEHQSVPFHMDGSEKVALDLKP